MSHFFDSAEVQRREIAPGVTIRTMWGEKVMMSLVETAPRAVVPNHSHPHEQAGLMLQGGFDLTIGGETRRNEAGGRLRDPRRCRAQRPRLRWVGAGGGHILTAEGGIQVGAPRRCGGSELA